MFVYAYTLYGERLACDSLSYDDCGPVHTVCVCDTNSEGGPFEWSREKGDASEWYGLVSGIIDGLSAFTKSKRDFRV